MTILEKMASETVVGPIEAVGNVLDRIFTSEEEKITLELARQRLNLRASEIQGEINKIEAQHRSLFVAGWRPFIGWVGGAGLCYVYLLYPLLCWMAAIYAPNLTPPMVLTDGLFELVLALLGLGGLRTFEKTIGRSR